MYKMKKVMVFFLLLLVACMGFAEDKSLKVTLEIDDISEYFFSNTAFTDWASVPDPITSKNLGEITKFPTAQENAPSASFWASAKTNSATPLTMEIYGTALTRKTADSGYTSETLPLILSIDTEDNSLNSSSQTGSVEFKDACSGPTRGDLTCSPLTLTEKASDEDATGTAGSGTRPLTWKLKIAPKVTDVAIPTAGSYESYIWLVVDSGDTGV